MPCKGGHEVLENLVAKAQDMSSQQLSATVSDLTLPGYNYHYWICKKLRNTNKEWLLWSETLPQWFGLITNIYNQCLFSPSIIDDNYKHHYCPYRDDR